MVCTPEVRKSAKRFSISRGLSLERPRGAIFAPAPSETGGRAFESRPGSPSHCLNEVNELRALRMRRLAGRRLELEPFCGLSVWKSEIPMDFEEAVLDLVASLLAERAPELAQAGFACRPEPLRRWDWGTSELTLDFLDSSGNLADVLEFHVVWNRRPVATLEEIEAWLRDSIEDVLNRRRSRI